jgi:hypothetical protein
VCVCLCVEHVFASYRLHGKIGLFSQY